jgi:hypothetical protein
MTQPCSCQGSHDKFSKDAVGLLERPRYSPGLILEDSDLTAAVDYTRDLSRLLFSSLFGCGVICGLTVSVGSDCGLQVKVAPGLALDGCGEPLQLASTLAFELGRKEGVLPHDGEDGPPERKDFWVIACAGAKPCAPRTLVCDGDDLDGVRQPTRIRSKTTVSIAFDRPRCACRCGVFEGEDDLNDLAERLLAMTSGDDDDIEPPDCHTAHRTDPDCRADCGCGVACSCGCCVVLAWVHWFPANGTSGGWGVLHNGVRRFIRPALLPDPKIDARPGRRAAVVDEQDVVEPQPEPEPEAAAPRARRQARAAVEATPVEQP